MTDADTTERGLDTELAEGAAGDVNGEEAGLDHVSGEAASLGDVSGEAASLGDVSGEAASLGDVSGEAASLGDVSGEAAGPEEGEDLEERLVAEGEIAGDYLEELLDLLDFDGDIDLDVEGNRAIVSIDGSDDLNKLVGRGGEALDALQELTRLAVHQKTGVRSRLMLDIARWRKRRRDELATLGDKVARRVRDSGEREELSPMTPFERKIVHDAVAAVPGVHSESEGVEPMRRVVVLPD